MASFLKALLGVIVFTVASGCLGTGPSSQTPQPAPSSGSMLVFITSTDHDGNLGGIAGADSICNSRASSAGINGNFVAWISDSSTNAIDRITSNGPWKWANDSLVFQNKASIPGAEVITAYDEMGNAMSSDDSWTGTESDGTSHASHCANWTSNQVTDLGMEGDFGPGNSLWSSKGTGGCDNLRKLICFQL